MNKHARSAMLCPLPPDGWYCTRPAGHEGPCAALPDPSYAPVGESVLDKARDAARKRAAGAPSSNRESLGRFGFDAGLRVVLEHLIEEAPVLIMPAVSVAYLRKLLEEIDA